MKSIFAMMVTVAVSAPVLAQDARQAAAAIVDQQAPPAAGKQTLERQLKEMRQGRAIQAMLGNNPRFKMEAAKNQPSFNAGIARAGALQADAMGPILREMQTASRTAMIDAYVKAFTPAELQQLVTFYRTPLGAKLLQQQPRVQMEAAQQVQAKFGPKMMAAQQAVAPKIEAELQKLFPPQSPAK